LAEYPTASSILLPGHCKLGPHKMRLCFSASRQQGHGRASGT